MARLFIVGLVFLASVSAAQAAEKHPLGALYRAAELGLPNAQTELASHYLVGEGVKRDPVKARHWFEKAANQGQPQAQTVLGWLYLGGTGVKADTLQAAIWFKRASLQGSAEAQLSLGILHATGKGVVQDFIESYMWLSLAEGNLPPGKKRDQASGWRQSVSKKMTRDEIDEARRLARAMGAFEGK